MTKKKGKVTGLGGVFFKSKDLDGNKVELWEPVDEVFTKYESEKITLKLK